MNIAEQARSSLFELHLKSAEEQRDQYVKKLSAAEMKLNNKEILSSEMVEHIHQRCEKIHQRI